MLIYADSRKQVRDLVRDNLLNDSNIPSEQSIDVSPGLQLLVF